MKKLKTFLTRLKKFSGSDDQESDQTPAIKTTDSKGRLLGWVKYHRLDIALLTIILVIAGIVSGANMNSYPQRFEDEGTYVSQAWAVQDQGALAHYTYWYDHPPAGWIQIAMYTTVTNAFGRYDSAISAGREFMLVIHLATVALLYALARRLRIGVIAAGIGTLLYALSPLVVEFSRYVLLDNVALPWLLGAFLLALSPRRTITAAVLSAVFMAIAVLTKETLVVLLPVLLYAMWLTSDKRNRRFTLASFGVIFVAICGLYLLYAALKSELFPGSGHVSLLGTLFWQVASREGSGSIFDASSGARGLVDYWLNIDHWLIAAGVACLPVALFFRRLRIAGLALLISLLIMLRTGYLPYPYIVALLPFAALTVSGTLHRLVVVPLSRLYISHWKSAVKYTAVYMCSVGLITALAFMFVVPYWHGKLTILSTIDHDFSSRSAVDWIDRNVSRNNRIVVESAFWTDLNRRGFDDPEPTWLYKTETDPEVVAELGGWKGIDYIVLNGPTISNNTYEDFPTVYEAIDNSKIVAEFGTNNQKVIIYQVQN